MAGSGSARIVWCLVLWGLMLTIREQLMLNIFFAGQDCWSVAALQGVSRASYASLRLAQQPTSFSFQAGVVQVNCTAFR